MADYCLAIGGWLIMGDGLLMNGGLLLLIEVLTKAPHYLCKSDDPWVVTVRDS